MSLCSMPGCMNYATSGRMCVEHSGKVIPRKGRSRPSELGKIMEADVMGYPANAEVERQELVKALRECVEVLDGYVTNPNTPALKRARALLARIPS